MAAHLHGDATVISYPQITRVANCHGRQGKESIKVGSLPDGSEKDEAEIRRPEH